ncbi:FecR protein [Posidoniimonas corsicana]|uniref:FecR protein n=1 Tax=Posidoniimonas corsicana TaxID=1938618 RepID=A0A5C5VDX3_9BACT|nr:FecR family protein [Posidoniimonas corsicana]TWT36804.1 FecR protein [Posidoniimonas corsicana]
MPPAPDHTTPDSLTAAEAHEVHVLCDRLHDGLLSADESARLNEWLGQRPAARSYYLRFVALHRDLLASDGKRRFGEAELLRDLVASDGAPNDTCEASASMLALLNPETPASVRASRRVVGVWQLAAAVLLAMTLSLFWVNGSPDENTVATAPEPTPAPAESVAREVTLSHVSPGVVWRSALETHHTGATLDAGRSIGIAAGEVELTYSSGTKIMLVGPAEFLVEPAGGKLARGGLVASVTEAGHGFTIETPNGKVVDLGTEFGVAVDDFGVSEVNVFKGKVEAFPGGGVSQRGKIELNRGDGLQWSDRDLVKLSADLHRFTSAVLGRDLPHSGAGDGRSLVDRFREGALDTRKWRALGDATTSPVGLRLGSGNSDGRAYLLSASEFDPALGAVTVSCDLRFESPQLVGPASFSILTRSVDERGVAAAPWGDVLASCTRCSFESDPDSAGGLLRTGVKLESNREVNSISWSGFSPPVPGVWYRVRVRDDGVNVTFTVSPRDAPADGETVTFRSLFRGKANHVAVEGPSTGAVLVDRVEISQEPATAPIATYGDLISLVLSEPRLRRQETLLLDRLAPPDAELIVRDGFDDGAINQSRWATLEAATAVEGGVRLGRPNEDGHIDTWKQRPYLLTRRALDPRDGALTILGRIRFADNFLSGYGASFAVMTRADRQRGQGPGWEHSVLQRGVRMNFWPAAVNLEHTLEVHEKPTVNSVSLLATHGVEVDPNARSYVFRVEDDGRRVALTVVDPLRPGEAMTVASDSAYESHEGAVAFESCWGSPVLLDDVRIYQSRPATPPLPADSDRGER